MIKRILTLLAIMFIAWCFLMVPSFRSAESQEVDKNEIYHNSKGKEYFEEGFYDLTPKNKTREASQKYELAVKEFQKAIEINDNYVEAHLNLARIYFLQKKYKKAAKEYKKATELDPQDLDTYVHLALAYVEMEKTGKAIRALEIAKTWTTDETIIERLNGYIAKLEQGE
jgi:tetratricopeptide (TPR) repeat protein